MYKIILLFILLFLSSLFAYSQTDTTRKEFFPLHIGDLWQYKNEENHLAIQKIIGDTVIDGDHYYLMIHSLKTSGIGIIRIDSLCRIQNRMNSPIFNNCGGNQSEISIYHLSESDSTVWAICSDFNGFPGQPLMRYNNIIRMPLFGQNREVMSFDYGGALAGEDTIWSFGALFAKGIGIIEEKYYEEGHYLLQGAIVNGIQYGTIVSINESHEEIPASATLDQNYPNPFNPYTRICYNINQLTKVKLKVTNILGEDVAELVDDLKTPGSYECTFNASALSSGVYIAILKTEKEIVTRPMMLIK